MYAVSLLVLVAIESIKYTKGILQNITLTVLDANFRVYHQENSSAPLTGLSDSDLRQSERNWAVVKANGEKH